MQRNLKVFQKIGKQFKVFLLEKISIRAINPIRLTQPIWPNLTNPTQPFRPILTVEAVAMETMVVVKLEVVMVKKDQYMQICCALFVKTNLAKIIVVNACLIIIMLRLKVLGVQKS